jgi:hypothetical protein
MGSYIGGLISIVVVLSMGTYLNLMMIQMGSGENDILNKAEMANPFDEDYRNIELYQENFLPHFELKQ